METLIIIGGGPAGMMASIAAASAGVETILLERNEKLGKKLFLTGKGRCNLTNASPIEDFFDYIHGQKHFMHSAFVTLDNMALMDMMEEWQLPLVVERGARVFPRSGKSSDVIRVLQDKVLALGVKVKLNTLVENVTHHGSNFDINTSRGPFRAAHLIIATGGLSYPKTGSVGMGYRWAKAMGHEIKRLSPGLSGIIIKNYDSNLAGLTLKHVGLTVYENKKKKYSGQGEMLFTHRGISGPLVLTASNILNEQTKEIKVEIDFKPALTHQVLDKRLIEELAQNSHKEIQTMFKNLVPKKMVVPILNQAKIDRRMKCHNVTKAMRRSIVAALKGYRLEYQSYEPMESAIITRGGVATNELNPMTMESKLLSGLYFAGEILNIHGDTGGYNLQIAFSTGYAAGMGVVSNLQRT